MCELLAKFSPTLRGDANANGICYLLEIGEIVTRDKVGGLLAVIPVMLVAVLANAQTRPMHYSDMLDAEAVPPKVSSYTDGRSPSSGQEAGGPSIEVTSDFLRDFITKETTRLSWAFERTTCVEYVEFVSLDLPSLKLRLHHQCHNSDKSNLGTNDYTTLSVVDLSRVDLTTVLVRKFREPLDVTRYRFEVTLFGSDGRIVVSSTSSGTGDFIPKDKEEKDFSINIFLSEDTAIRVSKALKHAVELAGGKPSKPLPF